MVNWGFYKVESIYKSDSLIVFQNFQEIVIRDLVLESENFQWNKLDNILGTMQVA